MGDYLRNCWYQAGWSDDLRAGPLVRTLLDTHMLFWRLPDGGVAALEDRCPHRMAPLSRGDIAGATVTCIYHGLTFGADGQCRHGQFGERIPDNARVRAFPVEERDGIIWFWPGDPALADPTEISDFSFLGEAVTKPYRGYAHVRANYQLETDNLLDPSHIETVHRGTFGGRGVIQKSTTKAWQGNGRVYVTLWMRALTHEQVWPEPVPPADSYERWLDIVWAPPTSLWLTVGTAPSGTVDEHGPRDHLPHGPVQAHMLTPETPTSTHYFWGVQDPQSDGREKPGGLGALLDIAFGSEDKPLLEAVQANMKGVDLWAERPVILPADRGGVMARRMLESLIRNEARGVAPATGDAESFAAQ